jgi:hypothetical protein
MSDITESIAHNLRGGNSNASGVNSHKPRFFLSTPCCTVPRNQTVFTLKGIFVH